MKRLSIIGRDLQLIEALTTQVYEPLRHLYDHTEVRDTDDLRGKWFEVELADHRIARVIVELSRVDR